MSGPAAGRPRLERRYRLLLRAYPPAWRRDREEILGVLLAGAGPDRDRPTLAEGWDLVVRGACARLRAPTAGGRAQRGLALGVTAVVLVALLGALGVRTLARSLTAWAGARQTAGEVAGEVAGQLAPATVPVEDLELLASFDWPAWLGWLLVAGLLLAGLHRLAGVASVATVAAHAGLLAGHVRRDNPRSLALSLVWVAAGGFVAAVLTRPGPPRRALELLGRRSVAVLFALGAVVLGLQPLPTLAAALGVEGHAPLVVSWLVRAAAAGLLVGVAAGLLLRLPAGRRALAVLASFATAFVVGREVADGLLDYGDHGLGLGPDGPGWVGVGLTLGQLALLAGLPLAVLAIGLLTVEVVERVLERGRPRPAPG